MQNLVKAKEEENKKGKAKGAKAQDKTADKKGKPQRVTTPKNKSKLEIKDKPASHKIDKLY